MTNNPSSSRDAIALGAGAEFDAIRDMLARWGSIAVGIGDDAAVIDIPRGDKLVVSVDAAVEGRHFREGWLTPREIGSRAVAAALSDLAAMAATPRGILLSLVVPEAWQMRLPDITDGIGRAAKDAGAPIVGGNTARGAELSITTTVLGTTFRPLRRDALQPGDQLYVTGALGGSRAALLSLSRGAMPVDAQRRRFAAPVPRLREADWLADHGAHAAIDVSDGLAADLGHLAAASRVRLEIDVASVPCFDGVSLDDALRSGEEYELVVGSPVALDPAAFLETFGISLTAIGRVHAAGKADVVLMREGVRVANPGGHDHFS